MVVAEDLAFADVVEYQQVAALAPELGLRVGQDIALGISGFRGKAHYQLSAGGAVADVNELLQDVRIPDQGDNGNTGVVALFNFAIGNFSRPEIRHSGGHDDDV